MSLKSWFNRNKKSVKKDVGKALSSPVVRTALTVAAVAATGGAATAAAPAISGALKKVSNLAGGGNSDAGAASLSQIVNKDKILEGASKQLSNDLVGSQGAKPFESSNITNKLLDFGLGLTGERKKGLSLSSPAPNTSITNVPLVNSFNSRKVADVALDGLKDIGLRTVTAAAEEAYNSLPETTQKDIENTAARSVIDQIGQFLKRNILWVVVVVAGIILIILQFTMNLFTGRRRRN